jgi:FkbM family methyltransferase
MTPFSVIAGLRSRLRTWAGKRLDVPAIPFALERLKHRGFTPASIFDVGAYQGAFAHLCRRLWPQAQLYCFDALPSRMNDLRRMEKTDPRLRLFPVLLGGDNRDNVPLHERETASSVLAEHAAHDFPTRNYPMRTVDRIVSKDLQGQVPAFLKLDVQGYELEVLKGAQASLPKIEVILAEINLLDLHVNVPLLAEVVAWLDARGFVAYDLCGMTRRPLDGALWQVDMIFLPRASALRADKRWAP